MLGGVGWGVFDEELEGSEVLEAVVVEVAATEGAVEDSGVEFVAHHQDERVEEEPEHDEEECADGAVEKVVVGEVGDVGLEAPGKEEEDESGEDGAGGEEAHALFLGRRDVVDDADGEESHEDHEDPTADGDDAVERRVGDDDAAAEELGEDGLVCHEEEKHEDDEEVEEEDEEDADEVAFRERAALVVAVGEVHHHSVHCVGGEDNSHSKADREEAAVAVSHDIVDRVGDGGIDIVGEEDLELDEELVLETINGEVGDEGEHEDE